MAEQVTKYEDVLETLEAKVAEIEGKDARQLLNLVKTITRWEQNARAENSQRFWDLQMLNDQVEQELLKKLK